MAQGRPGIKTAVAREVRQRCGFGCVICGQPIYHYDHLLGYALTHRHLASEITLLCGWHHDLKSRRNLTDEEVLEANSNPFNIRNGVTHAFGLHMRVSSKTDANFAIGGNYWQMTNRKLTPLAIDNVPMIQFVQDRRDDLFLNLNLFNELDEPMLKISLNEVVMSVEVFDITWEGQRLTIRRPHQTREAGEVVLQARFEIPNRVFVERATFHFHGATVRVLPEADPFVEDEKRSKGVVIRNGTQYRRCAFINATICIGECPDFPNPGIGQNILQFDPERHTSEDSGGGGFNYCEFHLGNRRPQPMIA